MADLDCDCDIGDCVNDCDCCCCCECVCDIIQCCHDLFSWDNICCIICINLGGNNNNNNKRKHNPHHDTCCNLCCCCCGDEDDDDYQRRRVPTQLKQQESDPKTMKQNRQEMIGKESVMEHAPNCPCRGSRIAKHRCPHECWLSSPSLDLDSPMVQRFQTLDRENYMRGYESSRKQRQYS